MYDESLQIKCPFCNKLGFLDPWFLLCRSKDHFYGRSMINGDWYLVINDKSYYGSDIGKVCKLKVFT
jgi:hypothetical protein